ncbi:MAG: sigma 54-interacting transcriptional regulator [Desulfobacterales bacterium]
MIPNQIELKEFNILCDQSLKLLDQLNIAAFTVDMDRKITTINDAAVTLMELEDLDIIGRDCLEVFCGVPCLISCLSDETGKKYNPATDNLVLREEDPEPMIIRLSTPIHDKNGNMVGCLTILQDNTPLANLISRVHYEERSLKIILDNLDIGIFTVNRGGYITFFNTAAEKISGYDRRQVLGNPFSLLFSEDSNPNRGMLKTAIKSRQKQVSHGESMITPEGEPVPIRATYMPMENEQGKIVGGLATIQDLTLVQHLDQVISDRYTFHHMVGKDPKILKIFEKVAVVAGTDATVLIEGDTGTGKDMLAKVIHSASRRSKKPFVKVNCAALPDNLLESEMFGYARGAFTGAERDKPGRFSEADGGTIFLDEIGDIPLSLQAKLLRVLEDQEFYPLGSRHTKKVDVRIISATNRGLEKLAEKGLFRNDLFYRLNVMRIELPPLNQRRADLPILIRHIMRRLSVSKINSPDGISEEAMKVLLNYHYPGNVRELENILEHALIICQSELIETKHLPEYIYKKFSLPESECIKNNTESRIEENSERKRLLVFLEKYQWNRGKTAAALKIDRSTLWRKMKKHQLI